MKKYKREAVCGGKADRLLGVMPKGAGFRQESALLCCPAQIFPETGHNILLPLRACPHPGRSHFCGSETSAPGRIFDLLFGSPGN